MILKHKMLLSTSFLLPLLLLGLYQPLRHPHGAPWGLWRQARCEWLHHGVAFKPLPCAHLRCGLCPIRGTIAMLLVVSRCPALFRAAARACSRAP